MKIPRIHGTGLCPNGPQHSGRRKEGGGKCSPYFMAGLAGCCRYFPVAFCVESHDLLLFSHNLAAEGRLKEAEEKLKGYSMSPNLKPVSLGLDLSL